MIEANKILEILDGIDQEEDYNINGWWEDHCGADFGKEKLKELLDYIELEKNDIGLKDINGKSIYADSSIVEFEHKDKKLQGFFRYSKMRLSYVIEDLYNDMGEMVYDGSQNNFKTIDTIQENKLGLMK